MPLMPAIRPSNASSRPAEQPMKMPPTKG
jgi:hypothetical protein